MAKRQTTVGDMLDGAKTLAVSVVDTVEGVVQPKQVERIVPVPHIDTYSELPFALVERAGERVLPVEQKRSAGSGTRAAAKPSAAKAAKRPAKKRSSRKKTSN